MAYTCAATCHHNSRDPLSAENTGNTMATSVASPLAEGNKISIILTHNNPKAQLLSGLDNVTVLFQGSGCLNCAVQTAKENGFKVIIQS